MRIFNALRFTFLGKFIFLTGTGSCRASGAIERPDNARKIFLPHPASQKYLDNLLDRALNELHLPHADVDDVTLEKPGHPRNSLSDAPVDDATLRKPGHFAIPNRQLKAKRKRDSSASKSPSKRKSPRKGKTIEQIYQKKTPLEHILLRPDTYVGSVEYQRQELFVFDEGKGEIVHRQISYVPALYKIFDEILVNAADNSMRDPQGVDLINITINKEDGSISVYNNGKGVPIVIHKDHGCYVPELIFGHLLTSDNYDDSEKKVTGGRNGYGAKLANVFSKKFIVETVDSTQNQKFRQVFENNMFIKSEPEIETYDGPDYTCVTFWPDLEKFGMKQLDDDIVALMMKRAYDVAGSTNKQVKIVLNGKKLNVTSFQDYVNMYGSIANQQVEVGQPPPIIYEKINDRWEVAMGISDDNFNQVSLVNSINTVKGGSHVTYIADQLVNAILKVVATKTKGGFDIKPQHVKNHLWVFVNCLIENPAFDSQTKETLTTKQSRFGSTAVLSEKMTKEVMKSGIVETILNWAKAKEQVGIAQRLGGRAAMKIHGVPKLDDANNAGGKKSQDCTLILTEGDSAKALAVAGLGVVGRDNYGVFPLKGKTLNVRDASYKQVIGNQEISNLMKIMGLDTSQKYNSSEGLRYGSIMLMTDQDHDGSHIKGLLINLVQFWWPSLTRIDGFMKEFVTPIIKVWKAGKKEGDRKDEISFFTLNEYEEWKNRTSNFKSYKVKYFKGLGTSTSKEAKEYFADIDKHRLSFLWTDEEDDKNIDLVFSKTRADDRKEWINSYEEGTYVDHSADHVTYTDFVNKELVQFAKYDLSRSVPNLVDGLKTSQRKVLFGAFKKKLKSDIKVAQFVGYISEHAAYHHGEKSLEGTIINLAQDYVGSNNINLFVPSGQFGTRLEGGKDHAASRYIYTRLSPVTRKLFPYEDDALLNYLDEEGQSIEPDWFCPILPLVLVNGAEGIGTGWSTFVPNYNPREIIQNIQKHLQGEPMEDMQPWYKDFKGSIRQSQEPGKYEITGVVRKTSETTLVITELPVRTWTQSYKEFLETLLPKDGKKPQDDSDHLITSYREYHTEATVHFELTLMPGRMRYAERIGLEKVFKLKSSMPTTNMVLFDKDGKIKKYDSALKILQEFIEVRKDLYAKRKAHLLAKLTREQEILSNKARFILMVVKGDLDLRKKKKAQLLNELQKLGFKPMSKLNAILKEGGGKIVEEDEETQPAPDDESETKSDYNYLLGMNFWSLTAEKVEELEKQHEMKAAALHELQKTTLEQMWDGDLQALSEELDEIDGREAAAASKRDDPNLIPTVPPSFVDGIDMQDEDYGVEPEEMVVTVTHSGYVKRTALENYRAQRRGTKGRTGMAMKDDDFISRILVGNTQTPLLLFTDKGMVHKLKLWRLPDGAPASKGKAFHNVLPISAEERVTSIMPMPSEKERENKDIIFATSGGDVRRNKLTDFTNVNHAGKIAMKLEGGESLVGVAIAKESDDIHLTTKAGMAIRFPVRTVRLVASRAGTGVKGVRLAEREHFKGDRVISMTILRHLKVTPQEARSYLKHVSAMRRNPDGIGSPPRGKESDIFSPEESDAEGTGVTVLSKERIAEIKAGEQFILTMTQQGFGKRSSSLSYRVSNRGGKGIATIDVNNQTGPVAASFPVEQDDQIMVMTDGGQVVRTPVNCIRTSARKAKGVKIISVRAKEHVVSVEKIAKASMAEPKHEDTESDKALDAENDNIAAALDSQGNEEQMKEEKMEEQKSVKVKEEVEPQMEEMIAEETEVAMQKTEEHVRGERRRSASKDSGKGGGKDGGKSREEDGDEGAAKGEGKGEEDGRRKSERIRRKSAEKLKEQEEERVVEKRRKNSKNKEESIQEEQEEQMVEKKKSPKRKEESIEEQPEERMVEKRKSSRSKEESIEAEEDMVEKKKSPKRKDSKEKQKDAEKKKRTSNDAYAVH